MPNLAETQIYAIEIPSLKYVKIGITNNIQKRLCALQTGSPIALKTVGNWPGDKSDETYLHRALAQWRVKGEWFLFSSEVRATVIHCQSQQKTELPPELSHLLERKPALSVSIIERPISPFQLRQIRLSWEMSRQDFADLLAVPLRTYERWEHDNGSTQMPAAVAAHVRTIQSLKKLYADWDAKIGTPLAGTEEFDAVIDDHEKLWRRLFPLLRRE